jgi:hypothetical protein
MDQIFSRGILLGKTKCTYFIHANRNLLLSSLKVIKEIRVFCSGMADNLNFCAKTHESWPAGMNRTIDRWTVQNELFTFIISLFRFTLYQHTRISRRTPQEDREKGPDQRAKF